MSDVIAGHLPELVISKSMRAAANSVAACFHSYQQSCFDMTSAKDVKGMKTLLLAQKKSKQAYHLALKFLSTATLKANPDYDASNRKGLDEAKITELKQLLDAYLESKLNDLVQTESAQNPLIRNTSNTHPIISGPW